MTSPEDFLFSKASPAAKFPTPGATITGRITEQQVNQQTNYKTGELEVWPSGDPKMQLVITLDTDQRDPEIDSDDGKRRVFVKGKLLTEATREAVKTAGVRKLEIGGTLTVTYVKDGPHPVLPNGKPNTAISPPKEYTVTYTPPATNATSDFLGVDKQPLTTATPAPAEAPQPASAPAAAAPSNGLIGGYPADVLAQAGITPEVAAALSNLNADALHAMVTAGLAKAS